ncbi:MAG: hypothetical protein ACEPO2_07400 [Pelagibaca sp.]
MAEKHPLITPALTIAKALAPLSSGKVPQEILVLDAKTVAICVEVDGVDYIMSMVRVPRQRRKPAMQ